MVAGKSVWGKFLGLRRSVRSKTDPEGASLGGDRSVLESASTRIDSC